MKKRIITALTAVAVAVSAGFYIYSGRAQNMQETGTIPRSMSVPVVRDSLSRTISATGRLEPIHDRSLNFRLGGTLAEVLVREGEFVEAGTTLARLDQTNAYLDLIRAERAYERALLESIESVIEESRLELELARASYESTVLKAPFSGIVASIDAVVGGSVNAQTSILRLVSRDEFKVVVDVDETELRRIDVGQAVNLTVDSLPGTAYSGQVSKIGWVPSSTGGSVVYPVEITVEAPQDTRAEAAPARFMRPDLSPETQPALRPGLSVTIDIVIESAENVLTVPLAAVVETAGRSVVTRVRPDGTTEVVPIETGIADGLRVAVLSGLSEGDQVVMNNYQLYQTLPQAGGAANRTGQVRFGSTSAVPIVIPAGGV